MLESWSWLDNLITCRDESPVSASAGYVSQCTAAGWRRPPAVSFSGIIVCDWWLLRRHHRHCTEGQPSPAQPSPATDCSYTSLSQPDTCRGTPPGDTQYPLYPFHSYNTLNLLDIISLVSIPTTNYLLYNLICLHSIFLLQ